MFIIVIALPLYIPKFIQVIPWWLLPHLHLDMILMLKLILIVVQCGILMTYFALISSVVCRIHLRELNSLLVKIFKNQKLNSNIKLINNFEHSLFGFVYREHGLIAYKVIHSNEHFYGSIIYYYLSVSIPLNGYMVCYFLLDHRLNHFEQLVVLLAICLHIALTSILTLNQAVISKHLHATRKYIPLIQPRMGISHLCNKLRYDDLFERLALGRKQGYKLSPGLIITYASLFEVCMFS